MTTADERRALLQLARDAIAAHLSGAPPPAAEPTGVLAMRAGAFVSLHNRGDLRGCIGHIEPDEPLAVIVPRCAVAACSSDPRFPAVTVDELAHLDVELSILGPLEPIAGPGDVEVGRHGLVVEQGWRRGLLLPQVATEWHWDAVEFLAHTCRKAGLPQDAWQKGASLWRFDAEVFGDELPPTDEASQRG